MNILLYKYHRQTHYTGQAVLRHNSHNVMQRIPEFRVPGRINNNGKKLIFPA